MKICTNSDPQQTSGGGSLNENQTNACPVEQRLHIQVEWAPGGPTIKTQVFERNVLEELVCLFSFIVNKFVDYAIQQNSNVKDVIYSSSGFFHLHSASNCACGLATNVHTCKGIAKNEYILNTSQLATATDTKHACGSSALHRQLSKSRKNHHLCLFHENGKTFLLGN